MPITREQLAKIQQQGTISMEQQDLVILMKKKSGFPCETKVKSVAKMQARGSVIVDAAPKKKK